MSLTEVMALAMPDLYARAAARQHEHANQHATDETGRYWLARTAALEHIAAIAAQHVRQTPHLTDLQHALDTLNSIQAPACNPTDHQHTTPG